MKFRLSLLLCLAITACHEAPAQLSQRLAEQECAFARRCMPAAFEQRCRECRAHIDCESGACNLQSGLCRDPDGRPLPGKRLLESCAQTSQCGGYACSPRYPDQQSCVIERMQSRSRALARFDAHAKDPKQGCPYNEELAQACLDESAQRACAQAQSASCALLFRDCS